MIFFNCWFVIYIIVFDSSNSYIIASRITSATSRTEKSLHDETNMFMREEMFNERKVDISIAM